MQRFTELYFALDRTTRTVEKVGALVRYFSQAEPADAERATGYVVGGISPLGTRTALPTAIDESVADDELVRVSAGRRGLQVSLAPADLVRLTRATVAPIRRPGPRG